jgi:ABC-type lipoprotein release transport system permease subunit
MEVLWGLIGLIIGVAVGAIWHSLLQSRASAIVGSVGTALKSEEQYVEELAVKVAAKLKAKL